jgi:hypothetical protein
MRMVRSSLFPGERISCSLFANERGLKTGELPADDCSRTQPRFLLCVATSLSRSTWNEFAAFAEKPDVTRFRFLPTVPRDWQVRVEDVPDCQQITSPKTLNRYLELNRIVTIDGPEISRELMLP